MTAPSNANTSGLEVVAWRWKGFDGYFVVNPNQPKPFEAEPLVTAASAQDRISGLQREVAVAVAAADHMADRAAAAEARADRLAKALVMLGGEKPEQKRSYPNSYRGGFDAATDLAASIARAALQQETQP